MQSTISRFACRILVNRETTQARVYAAGFDSSRNIFLGVSVNKWHFCQTARMCIVHATAADSQKNTDYYYLHLFLQEKATKWQDNVEIDGLTTNGVLIRHPKGGRFAVDSEVWPERSVGGVWHECSVGGNVFSLRESRSAQQKGQPVCVTWQQLSSARQKYKILLSFFHEIFFVFSLSRLLKKKIYCKMEHLLIYAVLHYYGDQQKVYKAHR